MKDKDIIIRLKRGEKKPLEKLINQYSNYLACVIQNIGRDSLTKEDVEELVADVFILFWKNIDKFNLASGADNLKGYLIGIARNNTINEMKRKQIECIPLDEDVLSFDKDEDNLIIKKEIEADIKDCIMQMREPDQSIFIYYYYYYLKTHEIAKALSLKQKTVESRLLRGREKLKQFLLERGVGL